MEIIQDIISKKEIKKLLDYNDIHDYRTDRRPDVISKHPRWNVDEWPQQIIKDILDKLLDYDYEVEEVIFNTSKISFRLHADSGYSNRDRKGHAVLIPLRTEGPSHTVFFDAHWHGNSTKFSKVEISPFQYTLPNKDNKWVKIADIRQLLYDLENTPYKVAEFEATSDFINEIRQLVKARSNNAISKVDNRCYDYSDIENYDPKYVIDKIVYNRYLSHIDFETLKGLKIDKIAEWNIGNAIKFPRTQLHCASSSHKQKTGITIFIRPKVD